MHCAASEQSGRITRKGTVMKNISTIILVFISCFILIVGCAGKNKIEIQKKLMTMSDRELINHYKMLEMRMIDIDRTKKQSIEQGQDIRGYPKNHYNHLGHLHVGDIWNEQKREKNLTRGISPPEK